MCRHRAKVTYQNTRGAQMEERCTYVDVEIRTLFLCGLLGIARALLRVSQRPHEPR